MSRPIVHSRNISELFHGSIVFEVPPYQREYAWEEEQVTALIDDLASFHSSGEEYYVLGQLIIAPIGSDTSERFAVVDGQQRMTSLYLLLTALMDHFQSFGIPLASSEPEARTILAIRDALFVRNPGDGSEQQRFIATKEANGWLSKLLSGEVLPAIEINVSQVNVKTNYQVMLAWIKNTFTTAEMLSKFTQSLLYNVFVVVATVKSEEQALDIFEKLNSRGKPLNSAELLKNLIFMSVDSSMYELVAQNWNKAAESVFTVRPHKAASMGYLMQAMLQPKTGSFVPSKDVYKKWQELIRAGSVGEAKDFSVEISEAASRMSLIGNPRVNDFNRGLAGARYFGVIQHLPAVLEASKFSGSAPYSAVMNFVDARVVLSLFAEERAQSLYEQFWKLSKAVSALTKDSSSHDLLSVLSFEKADFELLASAARPRFLQFRYTNARDRKRIRFALAVAANYVERIADNEGSETTVEALLKTRSRSRGSNLSGQTSGYDLDHVFPKSMTLSSTFDASWGSDWVHGIGNLCLLHPTDNVAASDSEPRLKSADYASSKLLLTKSLAKAEHKSSLNGRLGAAMNSLSGLGSQSVEKWFFDEAQKQAEFYFELFIDSLALKLNVSR